MKKKLSKIAFASALSVSALTGAAVADVPGFTTEEASAAILYSASNWDGKSYSQLQSNGVNSNLGAPSTLSRGVNHSFTVSYEYRDIGKHNRIYLYRLVNGTLYYVNSTTMSYTNSDYDWPTIKHSLLVPAIQATGTYILVKDGGWDNPGSGPVETTYYQTVTVR